MKQDVALPDHVVVQRFTPPASASFISMGSASDDQAAVHIRELYAATKVKRAEDLSFIGPLSGTATFPDTFNWDWREPIGEMPRVWRANRKAGRFILIVMGGSGSSLIAELLDADDLVTADTLVRVYPHALHLPVSVGMSLEGVRFVFEAGNRKIESSISIGSDPGAGPEGSYPPSTPHPGAEITADQRSAILNALDQEIIAWGEELSATYRVNAAGQPGWPAELCRNVLPNKDRTTEIAEILKAVAILAFEKFAAASPNELVVTVTAPYRPSPIQGIDSRPWSVFINLRNESVPVAMHMWIEKTVLSAFAKRWPEGWYEVISPASYSRLGVQSQMSKAKATIKGPLSNHQKIAAMGVIGSAD